MNKTHFPKSSDPEVMKCFFNGFRWQVAEAIQKLGAESDYIKRIFALEIRETEIKKLEAELKFEYEKYLDFGFKNTPHWLKSICGDRIKNLIKKLNSKKVGLEFIKQNKKKSSEITSEMIARAKQYPVEKLIEVNRAGFALCPFHNETTPSLKIFKDNAWRCFGCGAYGDTIEFIRKKNSLNFVEAIKFLVNL